MRRTRIVYFPFLMTGYRVKLGTFIINGTSDECADGSVDKLTHATGPFLELGLHYTYRIGHRNVRVTAAGARMRK